MGWERDRKGWDGGGMGKVGMGEEWERLGMGE